MLNIPRPAFILIVVLSAVVGSITSKLVVDRLFHPGGDASIDETLAKTADEINKRMPLTIDAETRCDSVTPAPNKTFVYHYTMVNLTKDQVDSTRIADRVRPILTNNYKTVEQMKMLRDNGVILEYRYFDKNGVLSFSVTVDPHDFQ